MSPANPMDIVRRTPGDNCGKCGHPSCLAFAAAVTRLGGDPGLCPFLDKEGLELEPSQPKTAEGLATEHDLALVQHLKGEIADLDFSLLAGPLGANYNVDKPDTLIFSYLGQQVTLAKSGILINNDQPADPRDQILLYNYINLGGGKQPDGTWIGMESMPNSISKVKTLATYCEEKLAREFTSRKTVELNSAAHKLGGSIDSDASAAVGFVIKVLPMLPQYVLYWEEEPEDGFDAKVKVLFDHHALDFLDIESLLFSAERMAERFVGLLQGVG